MGDLVREHMLEIGAVAAGVGLVLTVVSFTAYLADPALLAGYETALRGGWNLWVMAIGPSMLLFGGWYFGEQILLRRRFEENIDIQKRSEYRDRVRDLEETVAKLPAEYQERLEETVEEFR